MKSSFIFLHSALFPRLSTWQSTFEKRMISNRQLPLKVNLEKTSNIVMAGRLLVFCTSVNRLPGGFDTLPFNMQTKMQAHTHTPLQTQIKTTASFIQDLYTRTVCLIIYWGLGRSLEDRSIAGNVTIYNTMIQNPEGGWAKLNMPFYLFKKCEPESV